MMNRKIVIFCLLIGSVFLAGNVYAQSAANVDYKGQLVVDLDLDGLTDEGELQLYKTDPNNADSDNDGFLDGSEIMASSDPLDASSVPGTRERLRIQNIANTVAIETSWAWYISRVSGLVGFALLYVSIFLALTIRIPFLRKIFAPAIALNAHGWIALQATIFAFLHGAILVFDKYIEMNLFNVFVPFTSPFEPLWVGTGTIAFYLMVILVVSSYLRRYISFKLWRGIHFLNIALYFGTIAHALFLGTDLKNETFRTFFIVANVLLMLLMFFNMFLRIGQNIQRKKAIANNINPIE